jgi:hypothetical protein
MAVIWTSSVSSYMENLSIKLGQMLTSSSGMLITRSITWFSYLRKQNPQTPDQFPHLANIYYSLAGANLDNFVSRQTFS